MSRQPEQPFAPREFERVLAELPVELRELAIVARATGMRAGELLALQWTDVSLDFESGWVWVGRTLDADGRVRFSKQPLPRRVPLSQPAREAFERLPRLTEFVFVRRCADGSVRPLTVREVSYHWRSACKRAGVQLRSFHALRHTFVSQNLAAGVPVEEIAQWAGVQARTLARNHLPFWRRPWLPWPDTTPPSGQMRGRGWIVKQKNGWAARWRETDPARPGKVVTRQRSFQKLHDARQWLSKLAAESWRRGADDV